MRKPRHSSLRANLRTSDTVGGGPKKVLYTLNTVRRIGLKQSAKALTANNACKACALGMGGQRGGMINELNEYPSVCNKSIQAQSTDIQPPIPEEIFQHPIAELKELTPFELEHLGRLGHPLYKPKDSDRYEVAEWDWVIKHIADTFARTAPERSFFYSSGRSSNEAGFVLQLLSRLYGSNNITNCSYYCHQATGVGLESTVGTSTATVELDDLSGCDLVFLFGANPSSNHPRLMHKLKGVRDRDGDVIIVNPAKEPGLVKFSLPKSIRSMVKGGDWIASEYLQPKVGSDLALIKGIAKAIVEKNGQNHVFIKNHTEGFDDFLSDIKNTDWDSIEQHCGIARARIEEIAAIYAKSEKAIFAWGMGMTHHRWGVNNVEYIANLALLRGMVGKPNAGLLPLRGHSNIQGIGSMGVKPALSDEIVKRMEQHLNIKMPESKGMDTLACLQAADNNEIDAALMLGGNLYAATPDSQWAEEALDKIGLKVFLSTTLNQGHLFGSEGSESIVLPVMARDEEREPTTQESMFNYVRLSDGGIDRLDNVRPESDILCDIGLQLISDSPIDFNAFKSHQTIRQAVAQIIPGMEGMKTIKEEKQEFHVKDRVLHTPAFNRPNRRASFIVHDMPQTETEADKYPFMLMTVRSEGQYNSIIYEEKDSYRGIENRWSVMLSPEDMQAQGLKDGDRVNVQSETGSMDYVQAYSFDLPMGSLMAYYPEANVLVSQKTDPRSKTPAFKSVPVVIEKIES
ncbi:FdhF/YdeP family oxidoreductase [Pseudomonadota bacterium]